MKKIKDFILTIPLMCLTLISLPLNRNWRTRYGKLLGLMIFFLSKKRREITFSNLKHAFPEKDDEWIKTVRLKSFFNLGITFAELFAIKSLSDKEIREYISIQNLDKINEVYYRGKGVIFLSAHFGNWELMAYSFGSIANLPMTIIVKPQKNEIADKFLNKIRTNKGNKIVSMYKSAFEIIKSIKNKETIALLADQAATKDKDMYVEFFGRLASTYEAPAQLALKFNVPIVMGFSIRQPNNTYIVETFELDHSDLSADENGIKELTRRHIKVLEDYIRKYPEQWVWQHRRWKHTPKTETE